MHTDELVLSDVHLGKDHAVKSLSHVSADDFITSDRRRQYPVAVSRFLFQVPEQRDNSSEDTFAAVPGYVEATEDEDGDLVVARQPSSVFCKEAITIEHTLETTLPDVGLQVWQGCLLLCDYIVQHRNLFEDLVAIELGGGVGLASVILARVAKLVFCTDVGQAVLEQCQKNAEINKHLFKHGDGSSDGPQHVIRVRELDWITGIMNQTDSTADSSCLYRWNDDDLSYMKEVQVIIAADVVYDNKLTDALFTLVHSLMAVKPAKTFYVAVERRLNFTLDSLDVSCPAYEHFLHCVSKLQEEQGVDYVTEKVDTDFTQSFYYYRSKYLELWRISGSFPA